MIILLFQTISRFGKRGDDESFVNLQNPSDNSRMGKRGDVKPSQADFLLLQDADEALSRLNRPRYVSLFATNFLCSTCDDLLNNVPKLEF